MVVAKSSNNVVEEKPKMIKLIASDLDGTILQDGATKVEDSIFEIIRELKKLGIIFTVASGRQYHNLRLLFEPVKDDIAYICENGAVVIYQGEVLYEYEFPTPLRNKIVKEILELEDTEVLASSKDCAYVQPKDMAYAKLLTDMGNRNQVVEDILAFDYKCCKIAMYNKRGVDHLAQHFKDRKEDGIKYVTSGTLWLDVLMEGVNKAKGLSVLEDKLGITKEEVMAFGDNENDLEMLSHVGYSVAVNNAKESVKKVSKYRTDKVYRTISTYINTGRIES